jgi:hypothetical protein
VETTDGRTSLWTEATQPKNHIAMRIMMQPTAMFPRKLEMARPTPRRVLVLNARLSRMRPKLVSRISVEYCEIERIPLASQTSRSKADIVPKAEAVLRV